MNLSWDWTASGKEIKRALELNPNSASVYAMYAFYLEHPGRLPEAIAAVKRALQLDPVSSRSFTIAGIVYYFAHQYDQALAQFQRAYKLEPNPPAFLFPFELGVIYAEKGMYGNAMCISAPRPGSTSGASATSTRIIFRTRPPPPKFTAASPWNWAETFPITATISGASPRIVGNSIALLGEQKL